MQGMYEVPIERGKVREFARATQSSNVAYEGAHAVIPATFLTTAALAWEPAEESPYAGLGLDLRRILHGEEEFTFLGELPTAGQVLQVSTRLESEYEKEGKRGGTMRFVVALREFRNGDVVVAQQRTTLIETRQASMEVAS